MHTTVNNASERIRNCFITRHKPTCFSESCLLSAPGGSVLHNPAAQRLLFSRRKSSSGGDSRGLGGCPARCSTPSVAGSHVIGRGPMSSSAAGRAAPPLPRCFLSCNRLQQSLDDPRGDLGRSSCSLAADGAALCWPPVTILDRSEPSLELQVQYGIALARRWLAFIGSSNDVFVKAEQRTAAALNN
ncbi:hypothetical protein V5799_012505 [Amblyomma americanum]|uniref:Uncharacterized protein n=1 Tax=Amblyomma americanum TaxID=6943 RepID=A0AAQ4EEI9_AMBAM